MVIMATPTRRSFKAKPLATTPAEKYGSRSCVTLIGLKRGDAPLSFDSVAVISPCRLQILKRTFELTCGRACE